MATRLDTHPPAAELRQFAAGRISDEVAARLENHLARCPECCERLEAIDEADRFVERLRSAADSTHQCHDSEPLAVGALPEVLGDYRIIRFLGRGGMGVVYEAHQQSLGRRVALKTLPLAARGDSRLQARFMVEARAAARLHHTNIVPVFEVGEAGGISFIAMQFIDGLPLDEYVAKTRGSKSRSANRRSKLKSRSTVARGATAPTLTDAIGGSANPANAAADRPNATPLAANREHFANVAQLGRQAAAALEHAHSQGIVHRDIKPSNLLVDSSGRLWVADFGLAKLADESLTQTGEFLGTLRYMSPERFVGRCDQRADIYALGMTLYELLTGGPAFDGEDGFRIVEQIRTRPPAKPSDVTAGVPRDLETIVLKSIDKEPQRRYASAGDLKRDLDHFLAGRTIEARRTAWPARLVRWARRSPLVASLASSIVLLLAAASVVSLLAARRLERELRRVEAAEDSARQANEVALRRLWKSYRDQARAARLSGKAGQRVVSLSAVANAMQVGRFGMSPADFYQLRTEAIAALALVDLERGATAVLPPDKQWGLAFHPDGERFAIARGKKIEIRSFTGESLTAFEAKMRPDYLVYGPEGRYLAALAWQESQFHLWDQQTGRRVIAAKVQYADRHSVVFLPAINQVGVATSDGRVAFFDLSEKRPARHVSLGGLARHLCAAPNGRQLAWSTGAGGVVTVIDVDTGSELRRLEHRTDVTGLAWGGRDDRLAVGLSNGEIHIWRPRHDQLASILQGHESGGVRVAFDPRGAFLASTSWDGVTRVWDAVSGAPLVLAETNDTYQWSGNGEYLLGAGEGKTQRWRVHRPTGFRVIHHGGHGNRTLVPANGPWGIDFDPTGRLIASASFDGVRLWKVADLAEVAHLPIGPCSSVLFLPNGDLLTYSSGEARQWPCRFDIAGDLTKLRIGPPGAFPAPPGLLEPTARLARDQTGAVFAATKRGGDRALLWRREQPDAARELPTLNSSDVAVGPQGRWVVTSTWKSGNLRIWDALDGRLATSITAPITYASFRPDGEQFVAGSADAYRFFRVGDWKKPQFTVPRPPSTLRGYADYSADGQTVAVAESNRTAGLLRSADGGRLATLIAPHGSIIAGVRLDPTGRRLAVATEHHAIQLWEFEPLRRELRRLGLDWSGRTAEANGPDEGGRGPSTRVESVVEFGSVAVYRMPVWRDGRATANTSLAAHELMESALEYARQRRVGQTLQLASVAVAWSPQPSNYMQRGWFHAMAGSDRQALSDWWASLGGEREWAAPRFRRGALWLAAGDLAAYRRLVREMVESAETSGDPVRAEQAARLGLAIAQPAELQSRLSALAAQAHAADNDSTRSRLVAAMAAYRKGRAREALKLLEPVLLTADRYRFHGQQVRYVMALAHLRLGEGPQAKELMERADSLRVESLRNMLSAPLAMEKWPEWLLCGALRRQANGGLAAWQFEAHHASQ